MKEESQITRSCFAPLAASLRGPQGPDFGKLRGPGRTCVHMPLPRCVHAHMQGLGKRAQGWPLNDPSDGKPLKSLLFSKHDFYMHKRLCFPCTDQHKAPILLRTNSLRPSSSAFHSGRGGGSACFHPEFWEPCLAFPSLQTGGSGAQ